MNRGNLVVITLALLLVGAAGATSKELDKGATDNPVGRKVYESVCSVCHAKGLKNAPAINDKQAWKARVSAGIAKLEMVALHGSGAMPAKGGKAQLTDAEVKAAVTYMVEISR